MFRCQSCEYESKRKYNLQIHINNKHQREPTDAELIKKTTEETIKSSLLDEANPEMSVNIVEKQLVCQKCSKIFKTSHGLEMHKNTCKDVPILECPYCYKSFASRQSKSQHLKVCKIKLEKEHVEQTLDTQQEHTNNINSNNTTHNTNSETNNQQIIYNINTYYISEADVPHIKNINKEDISFINDKFAFMTIEDRKYLIMYMQVV